MKHDPELFNARYLRNDTRLLFWLKLELGTVCAYDGEIPLSVKDLAIRMKTSTYRINLLLKKLEIEEVVRYDESGKLFLTSYKFIQETEERSQENLYAKRFAFFTCEEFLKEERNVQRFVLHAVGHKLVYLPKTFYWENVDALYGDTGLLNIRTRKDALRVLEKASKYLYIRMSKNQLNFQITGVHNRWLELGEIHSEGSLLWVEKQLSKHRFCLEFISKKAIIQITKVMEYYYAQFGYLFSTEIFNQALTNIQSNPSRSQTFFQMIYKENEEFTPSGLDEISAYFRAVMQSAELSYSNDLNQELQAHETTKQTAERNLFHNNVLNEKVRLLISDCQTKIKSTLKKLSLLNKSWLQRSDKEPQWILEHKNHIRSLPVSPFYEINSIIRKLEKEQLNSLSIDQSIPF